MDTTTLAEQLYSHYCHARQGHDDEGLRMPCWPALPARERDVWVRFAALSYWASVRVHMTEQAKVDPDADLTVRASVRTKAEVEHEHVPVPPRAEGIGPVTVTAWAPKAAWDWAEARAQQVVACAGHGCDPAGDRHGGTCPVQSAPPPVPIVRPASASTRDRKDRHVNLLYRLRYHLDPRDCAELEDLLREDPAVLRAALAQFEGPEGPEGAAQGRHDSGQGVRDQAGWYAALTRTPPERLNVATDHLS